MKFRLVLVVIDEISNMNNYFYLDFAARELYSERMALKEEN
jgi:hypothetical protein